MLYSTTTQVNGQYVYRAAGNGWYVIAADGSWTGECYRNRQHAVAAMATN